MEITIFASLAALTINTVIRLANVHLADKELTEISPLRASQTFADVVLVPEIPIYRLIDEFFAW